MGQKGLTDIILPSFIHHPRRIYITPLVWPPTKDATHAQEFISWLQKNPHQNITIQTAYEPFYNAVFSILNYEKRDWGKLTASESATILVLDSPSTPSGYLITDRIDIPETHSFLYMYNKIK
jgi:hypothetical protein